MILKEFGLLSGKEVEDKAVLKVMQVAAFKNKGLLTFPQFLQVIWDIREEAIACRTQETTRMFEQYDKDSSGQLSVQEVALLFQEMGLAPTCRQGQDEIKRLLQNCDEDHNGELDIVEFQHLVQMVSEKLRSITRFREIELGLSLKFSEQQIREYRDFFWQIDKDGNGHLDLQELRTLMHMMRQRIDGDDLRLLMGKIDRNKDGHLDFSEFLRLVHLIDSAQEDSESEDDEVAELGASHLDNDLDESDSTQPNRKRGARRLSNNTRMTLLAAKVAHS
jgi:calmodulin